MKPDSAGDPNIPVTSRAPRLRGLVERHRVNYERSVSTKNTIRINQYVP